MNNRNGAITDFIAANDSILFKLKTEIASKIGNDGRKAVKIMIPMALN